MIRTPLTRWFDLSTPIIGAPMAGVSGGELARAVSRGGGLGMIGISGAHSAEFVTEQCAIPAADQEPFGVGLMIWVLETKPELFDATVAAAPSLVSVSFGDPAPSARARTWPPARTTRPAPARTSSPPAGPRRTTPAGAT